MATVVRTRSRTLPRIRTPRAGTFVVAALIIAFGFYVIGPVALIFMHSFNLASIGQPIIWSLANWRLAFATPAIPEALFNTLTIFGFYTLISFPTAVAIAWALARTKVKWSYGLEFMFWVSFMIPTISVTIGWTFLADPDIGLINHALKFLPFIDSGVLNIFSVPGIIWVHLMASAISAKVMLLTPAFRNMNVSLEEAARVSGASNLMTMLRVTLPLMVPIMVIVFMLQIVRVFQSFETEQILGTPIGFYVYSTKIFQFVRFFDPPQYGAATALASLTLVLIAIIYPVSRWLTGRKRFTTISGSFKPGLIDLGRGQRWVTVGIIVLLLFLTVVPIVTLIGGSFMTRVGFFNVNQVWTTAHWVQVLNDRTFIQAMRNTVLLSSSTAIISPILFSIVAYIIVRTTWAGRGLLEGVFWMSAAIPGMLSGLGLLWLFLGFGGFDLLVPLYGTIFGLLLVVILQGKLTSTQLLKGVYLQVGADMEEAARIAGAGWVRTYVKIWLPLIMPTLVLIGVLNFVIAAGATASIILLASRGTETLSILALDYMTNATVKQVESAGIVSLFIVGMTMVVAIVARSFGLRLGVSHDVRADARAKAERSVAAGGAQSTPTG
ncbi:MAG: iron ABC transporter permease [Chloroflexi bacterium]|nr:iron ABC transporter permease [Chloroflexota bacterium]